MKFGNGGTPAVGEIAVRVNELAQLFNSFDPSPFHEKDLDRDAEEYIAGSAQELPREGPLRIVVHLPRAEADRSETARLDKALHNYFGYRADMIDRDLSQVLRIGRRSLAIGVIVLGACLLASERAESLLAAGPLARIVSESFVILGWVANWKPLEVFLYDWWPLARRRDLYRRLAQAAVEVRTE
jgi:hypothetical protein